MAILQKARKILWARSGNTCAFPGCSQHLVIVGAAGEAEVVVGEEAHIVSQSPSGPRGSEVPPGGDVDGVANLLLLCPTHHRIIDEQTLTWTVEGLRQIKESHERGVRERYEAEKVARQVSCLEVGDVCGGLSPVQAWRVGDNMLVVCAFGGDPVQVATNRWRGCGLTFQVFSPSFGSKSLATYTEADPDIEFSVEGVLLRLVELTFDINTGQFSPFIERQYDLASSSPEGRVLRLKAEPAVPRHTAKEIVDSYHSDLAAGENPENLILRLRDEGLGNPEAVMAAINQLRIDGNLDGVVAEAATMVCNEIEQYRNADAV